VKAIKSSIGLLLVSVVARVAYASPIHVLLENSTGPILAGPTIQAMLMSDGYVFDYTTDPISAANLSGEDILVLPDDRYANDPLSTAEITAIEGFLNSGKGLLVIGETDLYGPQNVTNHASFLGITSAGGRYFDTATVVLPHPSVVGVSGIYAFGGVALDAPASEIVARYSDNEPFAAAGNYASGRWFVIGDEVWLSEDFKNPPLAQSVFAWLSPVPEPATVWLVASALTTVAATGLRRKGLQHAS
jgi:hypothetical protein